MEGLSEDSEMKWEPLWTLDISYALKDSPGSPGVGKSRRKKTSFEAAIPVEYDAGSHKGGRNRGGGKCWISGNSLKAETGGLL